MKRILDDFLRKGRNAQLAVDRGIQSARRPELRTDRSVAAEGACMRTSAEMMADFSRHLRGRSGLEAYALGLAVGCLLIVGKSSIEPDDSLARLAIAWAQRYEKSHGIRSCHIAELCGEVFRWERQKLESRKSRRGALHG